MSLTLFGRTAATIPEYLPYGPLGKRASAAERAAMGSSAPAATPVEAADSSRAQ